MLKAIKKSASSRTTDHPSLWRAGQWKLHSDGPKRKLTFPQEAQLCFWHNPTKQALRNTFISILARQPACEFTLQNAKSFSYLELKQYSVSSLNLCLNSICCIDFLITAIKAYLISSRLYPSPFYSVWLDQKSFYPFFLVYYVLYF